MPDIFGKNPEDYAIVRDLQKAGQWDRHQNGYAERIRQEGITTSGKHDFNALGAAKTRATQDQQAVGYLTNNLLAIQTMADEIMYTAYRLPQFVYLETNIPKAPPRMACEFGLGPGGQSAFQDRAMMPRAPPRQNPWRRRRCTGTAWMLSGAWMNYAAP